MLKTFEDTGTILKFLKIDKNTMKQTYDRKDVDVSHSGA